MSKPIFSDLYSISVRRNRQSYIFFFVLILLGIGFGVVIFIGLLLSLFKSGSDLNFLAKGAF